MAVTTDPYTNTDAVAVISEVWPGKINEALFAKTVAANFFTDLSAYVTNGSDIIHIPDAYTNTFTVLTQVTQGTEVVTESVATVDTTLTVNLHKYVSFLMGRLTLVQIASQYDLTAVYVRECSSLLKDALEDSLFGLWSSVSTNTIGDTATVLNDAEIREAISKLDILNFPINELAFFFHPYVFWVQLSAISKYYDQSVAGGASFVREGNFGPMDWARGLRGSLYGIPIYLSTNVVSGLQTYRNLLAHPSAFGFAIQNGTSGKVIVTTTWENRNLAQLTNVEIIYGVAALRETAACLLNASSAFINS
jgi:hypothetical protein